jgi:hypothetical protein
LPNVPETHLCIWGGETAGIVFAVNSLLEGDSIRQLLENAKTQWIVTLAPTPNPEIWNRVEEALSLWNDASTKPKGVLAVDPLRHLPGAPQGTVRAERSAGLPDSIADVPVLDFHQELAKESGDALAFELPQAHDIISYYLGSFAANLLLTYAPNYIVLGGGVSLTEGLLSRVHQHAFEQLGGYLGRFHHVDELSTVIQSPSLDTLSGIAGAYLLAEQALHAASM